MKVFSSQGVYFVLEYVYSFTLCKHMFNTTIKNKLTKTDSLLNNDNIESSEISNVIKKSKENYNVSTKVQRTPIKKRKFIDKIVAATKKGRERAVTIGGIVSGRNITEAVCLKENKTEQEIMSFQVSTIANQKLDVLATRELSYLVQTGKVYKESCEEVNPLTGELEKYKSKNTLDWLMDMGAITEYSDNHYIKGVAREAKVKKRKGLSQQVINIIKYYVDTEFIEIHRDVWNLYSIKDNKVYWPKDSIKQAHSKRVSETALTGEDTSRSIKILDILGAALDIKDKLKEWGISVRLMSYMIDMICPGTQYSRKRKILDELAKEYEIVQEGVLSKSIVKEESGKYEINTKESQEENGCKVYSERDTDDNSSIIQGEKYPPYISAFVPSLDVLLSPTIPYSTTTLPFTTLSTLRTQASTIFHTETALHVESYNQAIASNLLRYKPTDVIDLRQLEVMLADGALPIEYRLFSSNSPRVYSNETDNLFYCRKSMRVAALEGLGFMDVDLQSCHVHIALALWGDHLPLLNQHVSTGSLWDHYESLFLNASVPFYKSLIKAMHYATLLGGGLRAYRKAFHNYNIHNPLVPISKEDFELIVTLFEQTDICKELKALFRFLSHDLSGKTVTTLTGESFDVRPYRRYKVKGELIVDEGNLLTTISAILQSIEVSIISYLIVSCKDLFIPVLWQHDGLTIKALYSNTVELMQGAIDEFTTKLLGRTIKLESTIL